MNLSKIKDAIELLEKLGTDADGNSTPQSMIGEYVIVRSSNEGINAGTVISADAAGVVLKDARRIWYHRPNDKSESWYEGVARTGLSGDSKVSGSVAKKAIIEDYSMTLVTSAARTSIENAKTHAQS